jgi:hypothetical protein
MLPDWFQRNNQLEQMQSGAQEYIYTANHILDNAHTSSDQKFQKGVQHLKMVSNV